MRLCLLLLFIGIRSLSIGQTNLSNYTPLPYFPLELDEIDALKKTFEIRAQGLDLSKPEEKKLALEFANDLGASLIEENKHGFISRGDSLSIYLQKIVDRIVERNNLEQDYYRVYLSLSDVPNAANYGEGFIVFNLGLLAKLPEEAHIAFVLCHELAHDLEDHVFGGIKKKVEVLESETYKKRLKEIKDLPYNQRAAALSLRNEYLSQFNEHGREHELEADSIGLLLLKNAGYQLHAGAETVRLLDTADLLPIAPVAFTSFYQFERFPFQEKWLLEEKQNSWGSNLDEYVFPDSLKTHPSCALRDSALSRLMAELSQSTEIEAIAPGDHYPVMAIFENLEYLKKQGLYAEMLYRSLALERLYPNNLYIKNSIGFALYGIYSAQYSHFFSRAVPIAGSGMQEDYATLLRFLHRLTLSTLKSHFTSYVYERLPEKGVDDYTDMLFALAECVEDADLEERRLIKENYKNQYGENSHFIFLNKQFPEPVEKKKK